MLEKPSTDAGLRTILRDNEQGILSAETGKG
jgi:hypothetical protein